MNRLSLLMAALVLVAAGCAATKKPGRPPLTGDIIVDGRNAIAYFLMANQSAISVQRDISWAITISGG